MTDPTRERGTIPVTRAEQLAELGLQYLEMACQRLVEQSERIEKYAAREPARALGFALGAGVLLGWVIKRR
jgi:hypothetical protein